MVNTHLILTNYLSEVMTTQNHKASLMEHLRIMAHHFGWGRAPLSHAWFVIRAFVKR